MKLSVFASDYDDTAARNGVMDRSVLAGLMAARRAGVKIVLVTGRQIADLVQVLPELSTVDFVVAENGGYLYAPSSGVGWRIAPAVSPALVEQLERHGVPDLLVGKTIISAHVEHRAEIEKAIAAAGVSYDIIPNRISAMLLPHGVDKGSGFTAALRYLRAPSEASLAIGDAENDLVFLQAAGLGIAVADAVEDLIAVADHVAPAPGPQGVAEVLAHLDACGWDLDVFRESMGHPRS